MNSTFFISPLFEWLQVISGLRASITRVSMKMKFGCRKAIKDRWWTKSLLTLQETWLFCLRQTWATE